MVSTDLGTGRALARPGAALRALRKQNGWTLAEVSRRTGLRISTLSKIENDRVSLTYDKLSRLSESLGLDIAQLFKLPNSEAATAPSLAYGRRCIVRANEGEMIDTKNYRHLYIAADLLNKRFVPMIVENQARSLEEFGDLLRHEGDEFAYVLEGTLVVHTDVYAPAVLATGAPRPGVTAAATTAVLATGARMTPTLPARAGLSGMVSLLRSRGLRRLRWTR